MCLVESGGMVTLDCAVPNGLQSFHLVDGVSAPHPTPPGFRGTGELAICGYLLQRVITES